MLSNRFIPHIGLLLMLVTLWSDFAVATTVDLTPPNRPEICSGQAGNWNGNTYTCDWNFPLQLPSGTQLTANRPITVLSHSGMSLTNVVIGTRQNAIALQASGDSRVTLAESNLFGDIINTPNVTLTRGTTVNGSVSTLDKLEVNTATVTGSISANNGIDAQALHALSTLNSSNGQINLANSRVQGLIRSACCQVTITDNSIIQSGVSASANTIVITDSQVTGNLTAGNNTIELTNVIMQEGEISAGSNNVIISGGVINATIINANEVTVSNDAIFTGDINSRYLVALIDSVVNGTIERIPTHDGLHHVTLERSFVYGDVLVRNDWGTITGDWPHSAIYGNCEYDTVTPNLCGSAPPLDTCDAITQLTSYGVIGYSGFHPNQGSGGANCNGNSCSTMNGVVIQDPNNTNGNTPTPDAKVELVDDLVFPTFEPLGFPISNSNTSRSNQNLTPGHYDTITFDANSSYSFAPGNYYINRLVARGRGNNNPVITLASGDYFINEVDFANNVVIVTDGPVNLFVGRDFSAGDGLIINRDGPVNHFRVNLYDNVSITVGNSDSGSNGRTLLDFNGIIYGPFSSNNVEFGNNNNIQGSILVGGILDVGNRTNFTYTQDVQNAVNLAFGCLPATGPGAVDHFRIRHPGQLVSCFSAPVTIQACADANCNTLYPDPIQLAVTSSSSGSSWRDGSGTVSGSQATLNIPAGEVQLGLSLIEGGVTRLSLSDFSIPVSNSTRCIDGQGASATNCELSFQAAGLVIADESLNPVRSQYSGLPFTSYLWAVETNTNTGACQARVEGEQSVEVAVSCENPWQCSGVNYQLNDQMLLPTNNNSNLNYSPVNLVFDEHGRAPLSNVYPDVGALRMHAQLNLDESSGGDGSIDPDITLVGQTLEDYVVRPYRLSATAVNDDGEPLTDSTDAFVAAGEPFSVVIQGENPDGSPTLSFGREQSPSSVSVQFDTLVLPENGSNGVLRGAESFQRTENMLGRYVSEDVSWTEVGIFNLRAAAINYLGAGDVYERPGTPVGRFYPDHFRVIGSNVMNACTNFTYMGHDAIHLDFTLAASNVEGGTTRNYGQDDLLGTAAILVRAKDEQYKDSEDDHFTSRVQLYTDADVSIANRIEPAWSEGELDYLNTQVSFLKRNDRMPDGPYSHLHLGLQITDEQDNRTFLEDDIDLEIFDGDAVALNGSLNLRYGRMRLENISGPEDQRLPVHLRTEYWNGAQFIDHTNDDCTPFNYPNLVMVNNPAALPVTAGGTSGTLERGFVPIDGLLWQPPADTAVIGEFEFGYEAPSWLQFPWHNRDAVDEIPRAFAEFGQFKGNNRVIYWQEIN